jgi:hypothetical protein
MFVTPLPLEWVDVVITTIVPRLPFCPFAFLLNVELIFIPSVSRSAPSRCPRLSVRSGDFLAMILDGSWREAGAIRALPASLAALPSRFSRCDEERSGRQPAAFPLLDRRTDNTDDRWMV